MEQQDLARSKVLLDLLQSVESQSEQSQRTLAARFGVAVGLVNAYLKICIRKGYIKVRRTPARRHTYLLTPKGFAEKSRLTVLLLTRQLELFRRARSDYAGVFQEAVHRGWLRVVFVGASDLAEIAMICAREADVEIVALVDPSFAKERFIGVPVFPDLEAVRPLLDGAVITEMNTAQSKFAACIAELGPNRVLAPALLGLKPPGQTGAS